MKLHHQKAFRPETTCAEVRRSRRRANAGFTLVELLVTITILGVLAAVVVFAVSNVTTTASANACKTDVKSVESAVEIWRAQSGAYPDLGAAGQAELATGSTAVLRRWPSSSQYTITLDAAVPGQVDVALPGGAPVATGVPGQPDPCSATTSSTTASSTSTSSTTSTSTTTTTTAAPASNGVNVTSSVASNSPWYGENQLAMSNSAPITALSVTIKVARTPGVSYSGSWTNFWGGAVNLGHSTSGSTVDYTFNIAPSTTIVPGSWVLSAQFGGTGTARVTSGDTWTVTSTSGGVTSTLNGSF